MACKNKFRCVSHKLKLKFDELETTEVYEKILAIILFTDVIVLCLMLISAVIYLIIGIITYA